MNFDTRHLPHFTDDELAFAQTELANALVLADDLIEQCEARGIVVPESIRADRDEQLARYLAVSGALYERRTAQGVPADECASLPYLPGRWQRKWLRGTVVLASASSRAVAVFLSTCADALAEVEPEGRA